MPVLSRVGADRADQLRTDVDAATAGWADAALLRVDSRNQVLVADGRVVLGKATKLADKPPPDAVFLGRIEDGRHVWAVRGALQAPEDPDVEAEVADLRGAGQLFDDIGAQLVSAAAALLNWHDSARFSAVDGSPTKPIRAAGPGSTRSTVTRSSRASTPRSSAWCTTAVTVRCWPARRCGRERMFSLLAGFVEAGESFETCVAREIREEIGLTVRDMRYLGSQPWPFPRSLMIGFHAMGDPDEPFAFNDGEIAEAEWFTRDEVREALAVGDWSANRNPNCYCPGRSRSPV